MLAWQMCTLINFTRSSATGRLRRTVSEVRRERRKWNAAAGGTNPSKCSTPKNSTAAKTEHLLRPERANRHHQNVYIKRRRDHILNMLINGFAKLIKSFDFQV